MRGSAGEQLALMVMEGTMDGTRPRGAPRKQWLHWLDNIKEWSGHYQECKELVQGAERVEINLLAVVFVCRGNLAEIAL